VFVTSLHQTLTTLHSSQLKQSYLLGHSALDNAATWPKLRMYLDLAVTTWEASAQKDLSSTWDSSSKTSQQSVKPSTRREETLDLEVTMLTTLRPKSEWPRTQ